MKDDFIRSALKLLDNGKPDEARLFLGEQLRHAGPRWKAFDRGGGRDIVHCWTKEEFVAYSSFRAANAAMHYGPIVWMGGSYSRAYYLLALLETERQNHNHAIDLLLAAGRMEPDHPDILCLRAFNLRQLSKVDDAIATYRLALTMRPWATRPQQARAWRGLGSCLIDAERLDEAEAALEHSLTMEPESRMAWPELDYIRELRNEDRGGEPDRKCRTSARARGQIESYIPSPAD